MIISDERARAHWRLRSSLTVRTHVAKPKAEPIPAEHANSRGLAAKRREYILAERSKEPPTSLELIAGALDVSKAAVVNHICALRRQGLLQTRPKK